MNVCFFGHFFFTLDIHVAKLKITEKLVFLIIIIIIFVLMWKKIGSRRRTMTENEKYVRNFTFVSLFSYDDLQNPLKSVRPSDISFFKTRHHRKKVP